MQPAKDDEDDQKPLNLQPCPDCDVMISRKAFICPHCGRSIRSNELWILAHIIVFGIVLYLAVAAVALILAVVARPVQPAAAQPHAAAAAR